jgi:two-component system response regulator DesR
MIKVLVVEDMPILREALAAVLSLEPDIEVVAELDRGDNVVEVALTRRPNVAIMDIDLPGIDGIAAARDLRRRVPACRVLILTGLNHPSNLREALEARVSGFMLKESPVSRLVEAVRSIARDERVIDSNAAADAIGASRSPISDRELAVLRYAAEGAPVKEIADNLFLSAGTVRNYLSAAIRKSGARNRIDAIRIARQAHWL